MSDLVENGLFSVFRNPIHRTIIAWLWIAIMSLALAFVAARQMVVYDRLEHYSVTEQRVEKDFNEIRNQVKELELWRAQAELELKACKAHQSLRTK